MEKSKTITSTKMFETSRFSENGYVKYRNPFPGKEQDSVLVPTETSKEIWDLIWDQQKLVCQLILNEMDIFKVIEKLDNETDYKSVGKIPTMIIEHTLYRILTDDENNDFKCVLIELSKLDEHEAAQVLRGMFIERLTEALSLLITIERN